MTIEYFNIGGGEKHFVFDVISFKQISNHSYEIYQHRRDSRLVIKDVENIICEHRCLCHAQQD